MDDCLFLLIFINTVCMGKGTLASSYTYLVFCKITVMNLQEWLLQYAIGDDVIPWLTLHSMKLNLHYRKHFL